MNVRRVTRLDDPDLDVFRNLKQTNRTRYDQLFVVEGATVSQRLFASAYGVHSVLMTPQRLESLGDAVPDGTPILVVEKDLASNLVGYQFHRGVLGAGRRQPPPRLQTIIPPTGASLVLVGDQIIDQQNVGMMIRIGSAFGASAVVFGPGSADPFSRRVMRVSMGNGLFMPVFEAPDTGALLHGLSGLGYELCATVLSDDAEALSPSTYRERTVLVFGNETHGISDAVRGFCDRDLTIPMLNGTDSVNVAIATGIFSHSFRGQYPADRNL